MIVITDEQSFLKFLNLKLMYDYVLIHCIHAKFLVYSAQSASLLKFDLTNKHDSINKELFHLA